jgi:xanthine dehydrogenase accessory factor
MLVRSTGELTSTIGGGVLEARAAERAREVLATGRAACHCFVLTNTDASQEGMICGGEMEVLIECLDGRQAGVPELFAQAGALQEAGTPGCLVVGLRQEADRVVPARGLFSGNRLVATLAAEGCPIPDDLLRIAPLAPVLIERETIRYFLEPLAGPITVIVCGAGHVAAALVPLCPPLGFRTAVVDDRAEFANPGRFPLADRLVVVPSFDRALDTLDLGQDTYVIIVTRGHAGDLAVVRQALRGRPGYIGMIGSRRKRAVIFEALAGDGYGPDDLARVVCPVGLPIGAETPEEIAVSIVAQLIATRAQFPRR